MTPRTSQAFARYRAIAHRLPQVPRGYPPFSLSVRDLGAVIDRYDGFILDAYGVLNIGNRAIPDAVERIAQMRAAGKRVVVLTNGASATREQALEAHRGRGFDFAESEVVSSRDLAAEALEGRDGLWAAISASGDTFDDLPCDVRAIDDENLGRADGFLFLGSQGWNETRQAALIAALKTRPRPVICANPDIVAPRETGFTWEPGHFVHELPAPVEFFGKPFAGAFAAALRRLERPASRVAMVGDTLHTDILGGRAAGCFTVLIADHGFFAGYDPAPFVQACGITPDFTAKTT